MSDPEINSEADRRVEMPMQVNFSKPRLTPQQAVSSFFVSYNVDGLTKLEREEITRGLTDAALNKPETMSPPCGVPFSEEVRSSRIFYMSSYEYGMTLDLVMRAVDVISRTYPSVTEAEKLNIARRISALVTDEVNSRLHSRQTQDLEDMEEEDGLEK